MNTLDDSNKNGSVKFNTELTQIFITSKSKSDSSPSWSMLILKLITTETPEKLLFYKLTKKYSIPNHKKLTLITGVKSLILTHTELSGKPINTFFLNSLISDFTKSRLHIQLSIKMADTSDLFMNLKTTSLPRTDKINSTFLFTFVMENSTLTEKTSKLSALLLHHKMIGFLSLLKFPILSHIHLTKKLPDFSLQITGLFGMLIELKISEFTTIFMSLNLKTYLQLLLRSKKDSVFLELQAIKSNCWIILNGIKFKKRPFITQEPLITLPKDTLTQFQFLSTPKSLLTEDILNWVFLINRNHSQMLTWDTLMLRISLQKINGKESPTLSILKKLVYLKILKKNLPDGFLITKMMSSQLLM